MISRVLALAIAVCTAATGVLPAMDGYRCISMDRTLSVDENCPRCQSPPPVSIGNPCCEAVHVASLDARASAQPPDARITPAPLTAVLSVTFPQLVASQTAIKSVATRRRGRPPGDQLHQLSSVLRV